MFKKSALSVLAMLLCLITFPAVAAESYPQLAEEWKFTIKQGHMMQFLAAVKEHGEVRTQHGDVRDWNIYTAKLADGLNQVAIRYCCFNWEDADAYDQWAAQNPAVLEHWWEKAAPHIEKTEHYFEKLDWANSHWNEEGGPYRFFAVTEFTVNPAHADDFDAARDKMSQIAINQGWATPERSWIWGSSIGGTATEYIVVPHQNYASMGGGGSFLRFLAEHLGSEEAAAALMDQFSSSTWNSKFQLWEHHPEYSMKGAE
jgi:hypothetical protein